MKTVVMPNNIDPVYIDINEEHYEFRAGQTVSVPDEVACVVENVINNQPKEDAVDTFATKGYVADNYVSKDGIPTVLNELTAGLSDLAAGTYILNNCNLSVHSETTNKDYSFKSGLLALNAGTIVFVGQYGQDIVVNSSVIFGKKADGKYYLYLLNSVEITSNKRTTIRASGATDTNYPSEKAVVNYVNSIMGVETNEISNDTE